MLYIKDAALVNYDFFIFSPDPIPGLLYLSLRTCLQPMNASIQKYPERGTTKPRTRTFIKSFSEIVNYMVVVKFCLWLNLLSQK